MYLICVLCTGQPFIGLTVALVLYVLLCYQLIRIIFLSFYMLPKFVSSIRHKAQPLPTLTLNYRSFVRWAIKFWICDKQRRTAITITTIDSNVNSSNIRTASNTKEHDGNGTRTSTFSLDVHIDDDDGAAPNSWHSGWQQHQQQQHCRQLSPASHPPHPVYGVYCVWSLCLSLCLLTRRTARYSFGTNSCYLVGTLALSWICTLITQNGFVIWWRFVFLVWRTDNRNSHPCRNYREGEKKSRNTTSCAADWRQHNKTVWQRKPERTKGKGSLNLGNSCRSRSHSISPSSSNVSGGGDCCPWYAPTWNHRREISGHTSLIDMRNVKLFRMISVFRFFCN